MKTERQEQGKKILVIGGVAGGASFAARARRLSEEARIVVFEKGPYVSFANCGLPYHVGGEIADRAKLLLHTPESLGRRFNLDVRVRSEVLRIDRASKTVVVRDLAQGREYVESYDEVVLATGASPLRPPIPGISGPGIFTLRDVPDTDLIIDWISRHNATRAVVVGGGYVGLEMLEQLHRRGLATTLIEALPQVMAPLDPEMAALLHEELRSKGVSLHLGDSVTEFVQSSNASQAPTVVTKSGKRIESDLILVAIGVRPESTLAKEAGLEVGPRGSIQVNEFLQTSDPSIWAIGDVAEVRQQPLGVAAMVPLAGPANRQGRMAADNMLGGFKRRYRGTWGTAILRLFERTAACTGANEKQLLKEGVPFERIFLHPNQHAGYFPGAESLAMKLLFSPIDRRVLGAQVVGKEGVDKRIDVLSTALQAKMTVDDLAELELAYAPPFGSAKDPVNMAGMAAQNVLDGLVRVAQWSEVSKLRESHVLLDVREIKEVERGTIPGSLHIPLGDLRSRLSEVPRGKEILVFCQSGQRSYNACRILEQNGIPCRNLTGAYKTWSSAGGEVA
jgi:NADPH-dependent 2,4-dienoyl-CoA reductase/sulfur reductase-like enzyme/rhodanese-related sulfurtransferase